MNGSGGNDDLFHTFLQEATELLQNVEQAVLEVAAAPTKQILHLFADEPEPASPAAADSSAAVPVDEGQREQNSGSSRANAAPPASIVRVASDKIDRLIKLVGELVINQSRLTQAMSQGDLTDMAEPVEALERLVVELRDGVLGVRMTPIGATFGRFLR